MNVRHNTVKWIALLALLSLDAAFAERGLPDLLEDAERSVALVESEGALEWDSTLVFDKAGTQTVAFRVQFKVKKPSQFAALALEAPVNNSRHSRVPAQKGLKRISSPVDTTSHNTAG